MLSILDVRINWTINKTKANMHNTNILFHQILECLDEISESIPWKISPHINPMPANELIIKSVKLNVICKALLFLTAIEFTIALTQFTNNIKIKNNTHKNPSDSNTWVPQKHYIYHPHENPYHYPLNCTI